MNSSKNSVGIPRGATFPTLNHSETYEEYGEAYFLAAKTLWESVSRDGESVPTPDYLILPVLFLLHHFVELEFKEIIRLSHSVGSLYGTPMDDVPDTNHSLTELLKIVDSNLEKLELNKEPFLGHEYRELIEDLQEFGSNGVALRYPIHNRKRKGEPTLPATFVADVPAVMSIMKEIWIEVEGPLGVLREGEQILLEKQWEAQM